MAQQIIQGQGYTMYNNAPSPSTSFDYGNASRAAVSSGITPYIQSVMGGGDVASQIAAANSAPSTKTVSPVVTASAAQQDYNNKWAAFQSTMQGINDQKNAQLQKQQMDQASAAQAEAQKSEQNLKQQGLDIQKTQAEAQKAAADAKLAAANGLSQQSGQNNVPAGWDAQTYSNFKAANPILEPDAQDTYNMQNAGTGNSASYDTSLYAGALNGIQDERTTALNSFLQTANTMIVGLHSSEAALIDATKQQFQNIMQAQQQANASQLGSAQLAAARAGQEYSPTQAGGTIANVIAQGNQRLSEINSQMATTVANLQTNFAKEDYQMMNDNFAKLDRNFQDRLSTFKEIHDAVAADAKAQQDIINKQQEEVNKVVLEAAKNGAPPEVINKISDSASLSDAVAVAGDYIQGGSGIVGEYAYYRRDAASHGLTPLSFDEYQTRDANRKLAQAQAVNAAGLNAQQTQTALKLSDDYEQRSKNFYTVRDNYNTVLASAKDPSAAGDLSLIFAYMKVLDPNSTVREGEFATAQNAGSAFSKVGALYNKVANGERLTQAQRDDFVSRSTSLFNASQKQQNQTKKEFDDRASKFGIPTDLVTRETNATGAQIISDQKSAESKISGYIAAHPEKKSEIANKIKGLESKLGRAISNEDLLVYYPEYQ